MIHKTNHTNIGLKGSKAFRVGIVPDEAEDAGLPPGKDDSEVWHNSRRNNGNKEGLAHELLPLRGCALRLFRKA